MSAAPSVAPSTEVATTPSLEAEARALALAHRLVRRASLGVTATLELVTSPVARALERTETYLLTNASGNAALQRPAEWFLDNYYLIRRIARQVTHDLPVGFQRHLPQIAEGPARGVTRIDVIARALVARSSIEIDVTALQSFVASYEEVTPLSISELWALPTMLRISVLHGLLDSLHRLGVPLHGVGPRRLSLRSPPDTNPLVLSAALGVERSVRALRLLAEIDWKTFFQKTSHVEAILLRDPARIYARMDFETCDGYRKVVEELAWATGKAEPDVAERAVDLALSNLGDPRTGHVGYYLIDAGRAELERQLGYRARGVERVRRTLRRWPTLAYFSTLGLTVGVLLVVLRWQLARAGVGFVEVLLGVSLAIAPAFIVAMTLLQWSLSRLLLPRALPKLDLSKGIPEGLETLVVIPTLLGRRADVDAMLRQIELHYLSNPDPRLGFALLTDVMDARTKPTDETLLTAVGLGITALNRTHGRGGPGPFHLLHREPRWNARESCFMGWERKRGKLDELNHLLRGATNTSFTRHVGDPAGIVGIRYVITVDSDTQLPMGTARRLVGLLAHPLNHAVFDAAGRVTSGYTIVQPRIEMSPTSALTTRFARLFAGDLGFDIYTHATSESYQDLFGAGIYVGKGIYDVDAFMRSLEGRVPDDALASHDLFEGIHGRAALASDIVLFEDYPTRYTAYARRMHRWVRGDWQLVPWLFARVPSAAGERVANPLGLVDRWKIFDNLRRSLTSPLLFALLVVAIVWLPGPPVAWALGGVAVLLLPTVPALLRPGRRRLAPLARGVLAIVFLAHEASVVVDAVVRVGVRTVFTKKHLLQWTSAAHTEYGLRAASRAFAWRELAASPILALATAALVWLVRPSALLVAAPLCVAWFLAPEVARWLSTPDDSPSHRAAQDARNPDDLRTLRMLARRTWRFFDVFVGPNDQWLPIDNFQEEPHEQLARRTSPTNIGMMLLSTLAAYDLGYLGPNGLLLHVRNAFGSIDRLEHYQGHLLNWYETKDLEPLLPRYVSTVDSGNLAGCLLALQQGCHDVLHAPVLRVAAWRGLSDSLDLLDEALSPIGEAKTGAFRDVVSRIRGRVEEGERTPDDAYPILRSLCDEDAGALDRELFALLGRGALSHDTATLRALRTSFDRFGEQLRKTRHELDLVAPWLAMEDEPGVRALVLPVRLRLEETPAAVASLLERLDRRLEEPVSGEERASLTRLRVACVATAAHVATIQRDLLDLAARAAREVAGMDFKLLYDAPRKLFRIGYNVTDDQLDTNHYDLLASEARLASYLAIVKGDVPESHWATLGRPMTQVEGAPLLLSWGGTMFEYLMPSLLMRSRPGTLLAQTCELAVEAHIAYGKRTHAPWGISESAYARRDPQQTYQYQSFGVPGLGFKRGLEDELVVAPYASALAVSIRPRATVDNLKRLTKLGMLGTYGMFEALDLDPERASAGRDRTVVRSYMAHHQGMLLVAIDNHLNAQVMVDRFHASPQVRTGELLLNERAPSVAPAEWPLGERDGSEPTAAVEPPPWAPAPWTIDPATTQGQPQAFVIGNGRLSSILTDAGGGGLLWQGMTITRFQPDVVGPGDGLWLHLRDEDSGRVSLATSASGRTTYAAHQATFHRREDGISVRVDVTIAPADDVEVRQVTLHNESDQPRRFTVTSAGEPVLLPNGQATTHPAFARMFLESEHLPELAALVFTRRERSSTDERAVVVHRLVNETKEVSLVGYETDRAAFFGRDGNALLPRALATRGVPLRGRVGTVIDPIISLMARVELRPKKSITFAFVTTVARTRTDAVELARRYGSMHAVRWAFRDADQESGRRIARTKLAPDLVPTVQRFYSALLFADPSFRAPAQTLAAGHPQKRRLWERGISGDDPIVLVRVNDPEAPLLRETIAAQRYLRACGVRLDLVLVDEHATGYVTDGTGTIRNVLAQSDAAEWVGKHGGILVLAQDQLKGEEHTRIEATARVVLDTRDGSLAARMRRPGAGRPLLPRFDATLAADETPTRAPSRPPLLFDNGVGGFSEDGREYVIAVRRGHPTPAPWCNVLANPAFGCLVSESSLGSTWSVNAGENRLTPWRNDPVLDVPSEALYLRDEETAAVWSPTPLPAGAGVEMVVRHGAGYTTYTSESHGLVQVLTVFVPPEGSVKIVRLRLENTLAQRRRLTATYYAEWVLGALREEQRPYVESELERTHACLLARSFWNADFGERVAFLASEREIHGFTADRVEFLGRRGDHARPEALERWGLAGTTDLGVDPCAALQVHLELAPGESIETHFVLGQAESRGEALACAARFRDPAVVASAWTALGAFWDDLLGAVRVVTPEPAMDLMLNRWLLYQTLASRFFGRTALYQSSGAFGFRDQLQDVLALLLAAPERARSHILAAATHQFEEGDVLHWWHPPVGRGVRTRCSDDLAWLPFVTAEYVRATGDTAILDEEVPFLTAPLLKKDEHDRYAEFAVSTRSASLLEHCRRALGRAATSGVHGLPLMGDGDWNDGMNRVGAEGRGESVWLAWFLCATMTRFAVLCDERSESTEGSAWRARAAALRATIEETAWDGGWYLRAFHDDGSTLGGAANTECQIDSIAQSWSVLAGIGDEARARLAVGAADDRLVDEPNRLVLLLTPPFDGTEHDPGYIRAYPPGVRENGGQYTHAATWLGWAHVGLGDGDRATRIFDILNPIVRTTNRAEIERYRVEPYVLAGDVYGAPPWVGRGGWSWYTGAAGWSWRLGVEGILGLRKEGGGLRIDPCIPVAWKGFEAWIRMGARHLHVLVDNPDHVGKGIASITLDGVAVTSNGLHLDPGIAGRHEVRVRLGAVRADAGS